MHKFIYENDYEQQLNTKVEFNIPSDADLTDMLEEFQNYLKAIGFLFLQYFKMKTESLLTCLKKQNKNWLLLHKSKGLAHDKNKKNFRDDRQLKR